MSSYNTNNYIMESSVQGALLSKFRTNDILVDTLFSVLLLSLLGGITSYANKHWDRFNTRFYNFFRFLFKKYKYSIKLEGKITKGKYGTAKYDFSDKFRSVLHYIEKNLDNTDIKHILEITTKEDISFDKDDEANYKNESNYILDQEELIKIKDNIYCQVEIHNENDTDNKNSKIEKVRYIYIELFSNISISYINKFLNEVKKEYLEMIDNIILNKQFLFSMNNYDDELNCITYSQYMFETSTSFNNIFFEGKDEFLNNLNFFLNNKQFYKERGIPYRLGILLHGYPGCGKTSLIKCIANYTNRHIVNINFKNIKSKKILEDIFYSDYINDYKLNNNNKIYLIEEFDVNGLDILKDRKIKYNDNSSNDNDSYSEIDSDEEINNNDNKIKNNNNENDEDSDEENEEENNEKNKNNDITKGESLLIKTLKNGFNTSKCDNKTENITLGNLLEVLDGIIETTGRIIIFTTNNINKMDKALLRPGRVDFTIEFKKCSHKIMIQIFENFFKNEIKNNNEDFKDYIKKISLTKEYMYSPAEFVNLCYRHKYNINELFNILNNTVE